MQSQSKFLKDFPGGMPPDPLVRACYAYCMSVFCTLPLHIAFSSYIAMYIISYNYVVSYNIPGSRLNLEPRTFLAFSATVSHIIATQWKSKFQNCQSTTGFYKAHIATLTDCGHYIYIL